MRNAGFAFEVQPANVDETRLPDEPAADYVLRLAREKARVAGQQTKDAEPAIFIGADTTVALHNHILGKPESLEDARWMPLEQAVEALTYPGEREIARRALSRLFPDR